MIVVKLHMLTTVDNPYNPFTEYKQWSAFDEARGHYTAQLLGRVVVTSDELSERDQDLALESAIDEIVYYNVSGVHMKVEAPDGWVG
jgi:hypothetical protein